MTARIIARVDYYKPTVATGMACFHAGSMLEVCWKYAGSMLEVCWKYAGSIFELSLHCNKACYIYNLCVQVNGEKNPSGSVLPILRPIRKRVTYMYIY